MVEIVTGTQSVEAAEPVDVGVEIVGTALAYDVNHRPRIAAKLGQKTAGDDAKLLDRIGIQRGQAGLRQRQAGNLGIVVIRAVQQKVVIALARAIHREAMQNGIRLNRAWGEQNQLIRIAQNKRQVFYLLALDDVADLGIVQVERRNLFAVDRDRFGGRARDQRRAEVLDLAHGKFDAGILHGLEV